MGKPKRFNRKTHQKLTMDNQKKRKKKIFFNIIFGIKVETNHFHSKFEKYSPNL